MSAPGRVKASFDALLFVSQQGKWVDFTNGDTRSCEIQLVESSTNHVQLYCRKDGKVKHLIIERMITIAHY